MNEGKGGCGCGNHERHTAGGCCGGHGQEAQTEHKGGCCGHDEKQHQGGGQGHGGCCGGHGKGHGKGHGGCGA